MNRGLEAVGYRAGEPSRLTNITPIEVAARADRQAEATNYRRKKGDTGPGETNIGSWEKAIEVLTQYIDPTV